AGWQRAVAAVRLRPGDRVLAARSSYVSSALHLLSLERETDIRVELLDVAPEGGVDLDALRLALRRGRVALVTAAHMPTSSGLVEPVEQIGALCREAGVPFLLDATQSLGQLDVDVHRIGCDLLVSTGRKFLRGPRGTGLLYASAQLVDRLEPISPDVRGAQWIREREWTLAPGARRFELWEAAHALRLGLGAALADFTALGTAPIAARIAGLGTRIRAELSGVPGVRVVDPPAAGGGIVTFAVSGIPADVVRTRLSARGVHLVSVPASHGRWDLAARDLPAVLRASAHVYNDDADLYALVEAVREVARPRRGRNPDTAEQDSSRHPANDKSRPEQDPAISPASRGGGAGQASVIPSAARGDRSEIGPAAIRRTSGSKSDSVFDAIVVGLGVHGRATLHELARRGLRAVGLERFRLGHERGSSHGATRMIRRAYPNPVWDKLVDDAYANWARLERDSDVRLISTTGGLYARPPGGPDLLRGPGCRVVDAEEANRLMPALRLGEGWTAVYDPAAGVLDAEAAMRVQLDLAVAAGAQVRDREPVLHWQQDGDLITVHTPQAELITRNLVVCAGSWIGQLLPEFAAELSPVRIVNAYFPDAAPELFGPPRLGAFSAELPEGLAYGIPALDGRGIKLGMDSGPAIDPDAAAGPATTSESDLLTSVAARLLPGAGAPGGHLICRYTMTADRRFLVGAAPGRTGVYLVGACSGHGFKFAPALGVALADMITGRPRDDLAFLAPGRFPRDRQPQSVAARHPGGPA
ncbi:N-methyl-L-tryptophan oxidase, partial [Nocardia miyunensis]|uniref:N-methyl-L-tryptophan oxidase n=1 Tax=Nocardia miyunensis TaxID=282684 RepID=UPI0008378DF2